MVCTLLALERSALRTGSGYQDASAKARTGCTGLTPIADVVAALPRTPTSPPHHPGQPSLNHFLLLHCMTEVRRRQNQRRSFICTYLFLSLITSVVAFFLARSWFFPSTPLHHPIDIGSDLDTAITTEMQGKKHVGYFVSSRRVRLKAPSLTSAGELVSVADSRQQLTAGVSMTASFPRRKSRSSTSHTSTMLSPT